MGVIPTSFATEWRLPVDGRLGITPLGPHDGNSSGRYSNDLQDIRRRGGRGKTAARPDFGKVRLIEIYEVGQYSVRRRLEIDPFACIGRFESCVEHLHCFHAVLKVRPDSSPLVDGLDEVDDRVREFMFVTDDMPRRPQTTLRTGVAGTSKNRGAFRQAWLCALPMNL